MGSCKTSLQNKAIFYFHFDVFIFENKVARENGNYTANYSGCPAAEECSGDMKKMLGEVKQNPLDFTYMYTVILINYLISINMI